MNLTKKRWMVLIASCLINLCIGSLYAWSVFSAPMAEYLNGIKGLGLTTGSMAIVFVIANSVGPVTMISGGYINDKFGPKKVIFTGGILFGGGMVLSGFAQSVGFLIVSYGLMCGLGMGLVYGCTITNSVKFFPDHRGLIGGIATASYGLSSVLIPPIANLLIGTSGVTMAFKVIGATFLVIICSCSVMIEKCPENFMPDGFIQKANNKKQITINRDWKEMLKSPIFYNMILMLMCGAFCGLMCTSQASAIAQKMVGMTVGAAATAVSVLALFNAFGRVAAGFVSDRIGRVNTLTIAYVLAIAGMSLLYATSSGQVVKFYLGISAVGLSFGSFMGVFPGFTADQFGPKNNGVNYGIMFIGFALAGVFGPTIMNLIYTATASYHDAFLVAMALAVVGILLGILYRVLNYKQEKKLHAVNASEIKR